MPTAHDDSSTPPRPYDGGTFVIHPTGGGDVLAAGRPLRRGPGWLGNALLISLVLAVVIVSGGALVAYRTLSGGGPQPEKWAPASTFAFAKLDLDPSAGEKIAAYKFARKFPSDVTDKLNSADELKDRLIRSALRNTEPRIDYDKDVKPWLGDR